MSRPGRLLLLCLLILVLPVATWAVSIGGGGGCVLITEVDGAPIISCATSLKFTNGSVTDSGNGVASINLTPGAGGDASTNTATSVDNELVLFSGVGGKTLKRATITGLPLLTNGVLGTATAGTHYVVPAGNVATATALAANGANCSAGQFPLGVDASGAVENCTAAATLASTNTFSGRQDASGAASTAPLKVGTGVPGTCTVGDLFFKSDATAGQNIYECASTNTWTQQLNSGGGGGSGTVTATAGALTLNALMLGAGGTDTKVLGSLGSTTTLLHGNAAGAPSFGAVSLTADVTGVLPAANLPTTTVNSVVNDTNVTGSISAQAVTLGWTGTLAKARTLATTMYTDQVNTLSGAGTITGLPTPTSASDAATKAYVDTVIAGLSPRGSSRVATTAALTATYSNGASGVGATLTNSGTLAALSLDGVALASGERVLVKNQATTFQNGLYSVTTVGSGAVAWVLTRTTDYDTSAEVAEGSYTVIEEGTTLGKTFWLETGAGPFTLGTTAIVFSELLVAPQAFTLIGDVTASGTGTVNTTLVNIPTATPLAGSLLATVLAAPGTPAAGKGSVYVDSTSKKLSLKDDTGVVSRTIPDIDCTGTPGHILKIVSGVATCSIDSGGGSGGTALLNYGVNFTAQTSVTILGSAHLLGTKDLLVQIQDAATPATLLDADTITIHPTTFDITVTFLQSQSGRIVLSSGIGPSNYAVNFSSTGTGNPITILGTAHNLGTRDLILQVVDGATPANVIRANSLSVHPSTFDVVVTFTQAQTGRILVHAVAVPASIGGILTVPGGGTGVATLTGIPVGNGTAPFSSVTAPSGALVGTTDTQTLSNKWIQKRAVSCTDAATVTVNASTTDVCLLATLSQATLIGNPTGSPVDGQFLIIRIKSTTARAITHGTEFRGSLTAALPTTTSGGGLTDYFVYVRNSADSKWDSMPAAAGF